MTDTPTTTSPATAMHDPAVVDHLLSMTLGECGVHDFAVFTEGGGAPPCPWCATAIPSEPAGADPSVDEETAEHLTVCGIVLRDRTAGELGLTPGSRK